VIFVDPLSFEDWLKWREGGIGGSDAAAVMGVSPFETPEELWLRRTGRLAPKPDTFPMRRGRMLEPQARAEYERRTGIAMPKQLGIHDVHPWLRASFDGFNRELPRISEFKCPGRVDHGRACRGEVPAHYTWQCVQLMLVSDLPDVDYLSYDPGTTTREGTSALITVERDAKLEAEYLRRAVRFWAYVESDIVPPDSFLKPHAPKAAPVRPAEASKRAAAGATEGWSFPVRRNKR
jgi:putative phage-type endonuclease